jgi:hypothetical protein
MKHKLVKRVVALALSFTLALALFAPIMVSAADSEIIYTMATDELVQSLEVGFATPPNSNDHIFSSARDNEQTDHLSIAGGMTGASITIFEHPNGTNAIRVVNRSANYHALDVHFHRPGFDLTNTDYTIRVVASMSGGGGFWLGLTDGAQATVAEASYMGDGLFEVTHTFNGHAIAAGGNRGLRIAAPANAAELTVYEITIARGTEIPGAGAANGAVATAGGVATAADWAAVLATPFFGLYADGGGIRAATTGTDAGIRVTRDLVGQNFNNHGILMDVAGLRALYGGTPDIVVTGVVDTEGVGQMPLNMGVSGVTSQFSPINEETGDFEITISGSVAVNLPGWLADDGNAFPLIATSPNGVQAPGHQNHDERPFIDHYAPSFTITSITVGSQSIFELLDIELGGEGDAAAITPIADVVLPEGINFALSLSNGFVASAALAQAGNVTFTEGANNAVTVSNRTANWHGIDIVVPQLGLTEGTEYAIFVSGNIANTHVIVVQGEGAAGQWLSGEHMEGIFPDENGDFAFMFEFDMERLEETNAHLQMRIQTEGGLAYVDFTIYEIIIGTPEAVAELAGAEVAYVPTVVTPAGVVVVFEVDSYTATVNGVAQTLDAAPVIVGGRTLVPFRFIGEALGQTVDWDGDTRTVSIGDLDMVVGEELFAADGTSLGAAVIQAGRTLVPGRFVADNFGATSEWDPAARTVTITAGAVAPTVEPQPPVDVEDEDENGDVEANGDKDENGDEDEAPVATGDGGWQGVIDAGLVEVGGAHGPNATVSDEGITVAAGMHQGIGINVNAIRALGSGAVNIYLDVDEEVFDGQMPGWGNFHIRFDMSFTPGVGAGVAASEAGVISIAAGHQSYGAPITAGAGHRIIANNDGAFTGGQTVTFTIVDITIGGDSLLDLI